jgi:aspartyl-tRNA(Asn)/glutamyl-tRNA(Gln) amidotransferase subunit A
MSEPLTITDAAPQIRAGMLTPSDLLEQCLRRVDVYEPAVRAWAYLDRERARRDAARLTDEVKAGEYRGLLHGIPLGVKDIIDVSDMPTGCGSKLWANSYARRDATVVERLRQAGAVIVGKTVTTPFAYLDPPPTRNPWDLSRTPGGSSSGSAAAVASGMVLGALGTQTGGSLTRPASYCGVCSLKPTYGRVSVDGVLPLAPSLDHVGVMANCVRDLAILFEAIAGDDPRDPTSSTRPVPDCLHWVDADFNAGKIQRPGLLVPPGFYRLKVSAPVATWMDRVVTDIRSLAALDSICEEVALPPRFSSVHRSHRLIMALEAAQVHGTRFDRHPDDYPPRIRGLIEDGRRVNGIDYREARLARDDLGIECEELFWPNRMLMPATVDLPPASETTGDPWCNSPWSFLGYPTVSVPLGWSGDGLPLAVQVVAAPWHEHHLTATAARLERVFRDEANPCPRRLPPVP